MSWENRLFAYAKTKKQISFVVTAKLITAFVFPTWIAQYLFYLNPKFQASDHPLWLYSPVCVGPGQKPRKTDFLTTRLIWLMPRETANCKNCNLHHSYFQKLLTVSRGKTVSTLYTWPHIATSIHAEFNWLKLENLDTKTNILYPMIITIEVPPPSPPPQSQADW